VEVESLFVVRGPITAEAIMKSLQAVLPTRHRPIAPHRFTVLDTFDGRIRRTGGCLRRAAVNGTSTLAWRPGGGKSGLSVALDQPVSFAWDLPEGPLHSALAPVVGVRRLLDQADAEEQGSLLDILDERCKTVARVRIASCRARLPESADSWRPLPTMVTLTGLRGYEDVFERLVPVIESRPGIESWPEGPDGVVLREVGTPDRCDVSSPLVTLPAEVAAAEGARQIHLGLVGILIVNEPGLRGDLDTEFLHDFRVAVRRIRSLLGQIKRVFPPDVVEHFSDEFAWIGRLTGAPRDIDVLLLALRDRQNDFPAGDMEPLLAVLRQAQRQERSRLLDALDSDRYRRLIAEWRAFLAQKRDPAPEAGNADRPLADVAARRAWRLSRRIAAATESADAHGEAQLHHVRITAKKLRYLIDVTPDHYDPSAFQLVIAALKRLQRALGEFNDAHVQENRLVEAGLALGASGGPAGALLTLGRLAEQSRQRREGLRGQVYESLDRFRSREIKSACRRAFRERIAERTP
jgi:CHAD domain-containing protein